LSGRGLCDELITRPEESYRLWCVVVCDLETSRMGARYIYDISCLRVNPAGAWMSVSCGCFVLSDRDLCDGLITCPEDFYRVWCVQVSVIVKPR